MKEADKYDFPGGYDLNEILGAVSLAAIAHMRNPDLSTIENKILQQLLLDVAARHPENAPFRNLQDPYLLRAKELFEERQSLLNSHLKASWFCLSYWVSSLFAVRSGISIAEFDGLRMFVIPVQHALRELGIEVSKEECLAEVDRFMPDEATPRNILAATHLFLSFVRVLHNGALRRREVVTPHLILASVCLAFEETDAKEASNISTFLTTHGIAIRQQPSEVIPGDRLLVLLSRDAMGSELFWRGLADWKERGVLPMVVCLVPKADLYREPPADWRADIWSWLSANVAVELNSDVDRYVMLLRALDSSQPWWWGYADSIELGLAVDVLGLGIPRPAPAPTGSTDTGKPYPLTLHRELLGACRLASDRIGQAETNATDSRYLDEGMQLLRLRQEANGEPYDLAWFILLYRTWQAFGVALQAVACSEEEVARAHQGMQYALFALGVGTVASEVPEFLEAFANLPWPDSCSTVAALDDRTIAFVVLVFQLAQAALTRGQRMRLRHPSCPAFVSYAREDEGFARELVRDLEAKGADIWWDLNAITLGTPLDESLRSAVGSARYLLLIATPAAASSSYVRLEIETAIRQGVRIIPIVPDGQLPTTFQTLLDSGRGSTEGLISGSDSPSVLACLARTSSEQLEWLRAQPLYASLRQDLAQMRAS
jgi:hypothetical protein